LFFVVGAFAVSLPKAGAWMVGIKWVGGVALAYMAFAYVRDALPRGVEHRLVDAGALYIVSGTVALVIGFGLAAVHVAAERRASKIAHLSKPAKLASIVPAVAGVFMVVTWWQVPANGGTPETGESAPALHWESTEPAALGRAASEHKPLLVDFGASWCGACKELEEKTFPDPRVRSAGQRFVSLRVDATDDDDDEVVRLRKKYGALEGLPVVLLLDSAGNEALRFTEFVPPDRLATALAQVR
jgi:thiol:disulfide interchange protein DsbD